jgi:predicted transposase/invertase (TIGR01784 family)
VGWIETIPSKYHHRFVLVDPETGVDIFKDIEIHTIELNKFEAINEIDIDIVMLKVKNMLDTWVAVLTKYDLLNIDKLPERINIPEVKKALKVMHEMNLNKEEREIYYSHLDYLRIEEGAFEARFEAGRTKGKAEGKAEERITIITIVKKMLSKRSSIEDIMEITGLSREEIEAIQQETTD